MNLCVLKLTELYTKKESILLYVNLNIFMTNVWEWSLMDLEQGERNIILVQVKFSMCEHLPEILDAKYWLKQLGRIPFISFVDRLKLESTVTYMNLKCQKEPDII